MAYENQNKCLGCGISIPFVHEDADPEALLCDECLKEGQEILMTEISPKDECLKEEEKEEDDSCIFAILRKSLWLILMAVLVFFITVIDICCHDHKDADTINSRLSDSEMFNK